MNVMRFLLFSGHIGHYPVGGWNDFRGSFEHLSEALQASREGDWFHVIDTLTGEFVASDTP